MKTLCLSIGMILIIACCCDAMPDSVQYNTGPVTCCNQLSNIRVPGKMIADITKTHSSCKKQGFIVETVKGKIICFRQSTAWVEEAYNRMTNSEHSGLEATFRPSTTWVEDFYNQMTNSEHSGLEATTSNNEQPEHKSYCT